TMLGMSIELAKADPSYEDMATKFLEHFIAIADAINEFRGDGLWDETDGFYYDELEIDGRTTPLRVRSMVGLVPLFAAVTIVAKNVEGLDDFRRRTRWFVDNRPDLAKRISLLARSEGK